MYFGTCWVLVIYKKNMIIRYYVINYQLLVAHVWQQILSYHCHPRFCVGAQRLNVSYSMTSVFINLLDLILNLSLKIQLILSISLFFLSPFFSLSLSLSISFSLSLSFSLFLSLSLSLYLPLSLSLSLPHTLPLSVLILIHIFHPYVFSSFSYFLRLG